VAGANNYRLHKNEGGIDLPDVVAGNVTSFTDSPLQQNTKYTYQVIAMNNQFSSLPSVSTSAITSIDLPVAVSTAILQVFATSATVTRIQSTNPTGTSYYFVITPIPSGVAFSSTSILSTISVIGLTPNLCTANQLFAVNKMDRRDRSPS